MLEQESTKSTKEHRGKGNPMLLGNPMSKAPFTTVREMLPPILQISEGPLLGSLRPLPDLGQTLLWLRFAPNIEHEQLPTSVPFK